MRNNGLRQRMLALASALVMTGLMAVPALAETSYTAVAGTSMTFNKYLIVPAGVKVPNAEFTYTVTAGEAVSTPTDDNSVFQVIPGINPGDVTVTETVFAPTDTPGSTVASGTDVARTADKRVTGGTAATGVELEASKNEQFAVKQATVDLSAVEFTEPGIYRYIITEDASTDDAAAGIIHDTDVDRILDVYVTDDGNGALVTPPVYVLHSNATDPAIGTDMGTNDTTPLADKTDGFTNEYKPKDLAFKKEVSGNQASRDKYFDFTLTMSNVNDDDKFTVSLADDNDANTTDGNADATSGSNAATIAANAGKTNKNEVTGAELKSGVHFYLQHGQSIAVRGLPLNATYNVTENAEDYKSEAATVTGYTDPKEGTLGSFTAQAVKTSYKNTRNGVIPTGVVMTVLPFIGIAVVGGAGFAFASRRKKEDED